MAKIQVLQFDCKNFRFPAQPFISHPFLPPHVRDRPWTRTQIPRACKPWLHMKRPHTLHATRREIKYAPVIQGTPLSILSHRYKILRAMFFRKHPPIGENRSYSGECWYNRGGRKVLEGKVVTKKFIFLNISIGVFRLIICCTCVHVTRMMEVSLYC